LPAFAGAGRAPRVNYNDAPGGALGAAHHSAAIAIGCARLLGIFAHLENTFGHPSAIPIQIRLREPAHRDRRGNISGQVAVVAGADEVRGTKSIDKAPGELRVRSAGSLAHSQELRPGLAPHPIEDIGHFC
jgi:hypothetical protein